MTTPLVSIIIPVLNAEEHILRCLRSIKDLDQSHAVCEVVVMDNGSTDRTPEIVREFGFEVHIVPKIYVAGLRNRGAAFSRGEFLAFVDADVELSPDWVQQALAIFRDPSVIAGGCFPRVPQEATWVQAAWDVHQRLQHGKSQHAQPVAWLPSMNMIVRREAFLAVGGFNEELETAEDVDLCYRLSERGTILRSPALKAVHWGEAPDLRTFWRKEVWRGLGNLRGVFSHGIRMDEIPSLGYPVYVLTLLLVLTFGALSDISEQQIFFLPLLFLAFMLPGLLLALKTGWAANRPSSIPSLFVLYLVYGLARAYAMVKALGGVPRVKPALAR